MPPTPTTLHPTPAPIPLPNTSTLHPPTTTTNPPPSTPAPTCSIRIQHITTPSTLSEVSLFINASRRILFPSLGHDALLDDVAILNKEEEGNCVLAARNEEGEVVAAVVYVPFDYRFGQLGWPFGSSSSSSSPSSITTSSSSSSSPTPSPPSSTTSTSHSPPRKIVEVLRLFVLPAYRRCGLAARLFSVLKEHAVAAGVEYMYLHTHPFLPGAIRFWEKQGFGVVCVDDEDEVWQTHHMGMMLRSP